MSFKSLFVASSRQVFVWCWCLFVIVLLFSRGFMVLFLVDTTRERESSLTIVA